jgi:predicted nuclease with TOPRIM domain
MKRSRSSDDSSQSDSAFPQSQLHQQELGKLRERQTRSREKYQQLKSQYDDLALKYQILEEHTKLLEAATARPVAPPPSHPPHSISAA